MKLFKTLLTILIIFLFLSAINLFIISYIKTGTSFIPVTLGSIPENITSYNGTLQFYPNMLFNHKNLSYKIQQTCELEKKLNTRQAFHAIEIKTQNLLTFYEADSNEDILIECNQTNEQYELGKKEAFFVAGEGGPDKAVSTGMSWVIEHGKVLLYYPRNKECMSYNIELHELLHVFGFKHSDNKYSIMYNVSECNQVMSDDIINEFLRLYNLPELADVYIANISAVKRGMYIDFNIEVRNQGIRGATNATLFLSSENKQIKSFSLEDIGYGEGKILEVENVRIPLTMLALKDITFSASSESEEISYENNNITLSIQN